jgi:hypothetical protein
MSNALELLLYSFKNDVPFKITIELVIDHY